MLPTPSNFVASLIAILWVIGLLGFVGGIGSGILKFDDAQFNLISGFLFGSGSTVLMFYFGSSKSEERKTEALISPPDPPAGTVVTKTTTTAPATPPPREVWTPDQRAAALGQTRQ
jgi:hypothetical protein